MKASELKNKGLKAQQQQQEVKKKPAAQPGQPEKEKKKRQPIKRSLLCELIGKDTQKVYKKDSEYLGSTFYKLKTRNIENMENDAPAIVYAFKEAICNPEECPNEKELKRKEEVWRIIERDEYLGKRYIVYCYYVPMGYGNYGYKVIDLLER